MKTFQYLKRINSNISDRYYEVEKMIMYASSSFFDALGNLLEVYMVTVAKKNNIKIEHGMSHGKISNVLQPFLFNVVKMDLYTFQRIKQISERINKHKHNIIKYINREVCTNNLESFFDFYSLIAEYEWPQFSEKFDYQYYNNIYGIFSLNNLKNLINGYKELADKVDENINNSLEKVNKFEKLINIFSNSNK